MNLPDFIIIGSAKSGTTTIYRQLLDDNSFVLCDPKEPDFFARDDVYANGLEWYSSLFKGAVDGQLYGEASTLYTLSPLFPETAKRMHSAVPNAKLIYVMRSPVRRAYSYYVQLLKNFQNSYDTTEIPLTFEEFLFSDERSATGKPCLAKFDNHLPFGPQLLTSGGMYFEQISQYLQHYKIESLHLMVFEDFIEDPKAELSTLYDFLGVDFSKMAENFIEHRVNISEDHFRKRLSDEMVKKLQVLPMYNVFKNMMGSGIKDRIKDVVAGKLLYGIQGDQNQPDKMKLETEQYLKELYLEPTKQLSELVGRDFVKLWGLDPNAG